MRIVEYTPECFDALQEMVQRIEARGEEHCSALKHQRFVDYYYAGRDNCRLYLLTSNRDVVQAVLGIEQMPFEWNGRRQTLGFGSNFLSLLPGAGGYLFMHWLQLAPIGLAFGASSDGLRILNSQKWTNFDGARTLHLNRPIRIYPDDTRWRRLMKRVARVRLRPRLQRYAARLGGEANAHVNVQEERCYREDLLPRKSPFTFRFAPDVGYLVWRYNLNLPFVRYRLYRIVHQGRSAGYVILNDRPDTLMVAHCDGEDAQVLASGVLRSLVEASREDRQPREVLLACSHRGMQDLYQRAGFRLSRKDRPLVLGSRTQAIDLPRDTSNWLINFDWGDNGLRGPFRDEACEAVPCGVPV